MSVDLDISMSGAGGGAAVGLVQFQARTRPKAVKRKVAKRPFAAVNVPADRRAAPVQTNDEPRAGTSG